MPMAWAIPLLRSTLPVLVAALLGASAVAAPPGRAGPVFLVSVDGLRSDLIGRAEAPHLRRLAAEGARAVAARTVKPAVTMASHASMLSGLLPKDHGIDYNSVRPERGSMKAASLLGVAQAAGLEVAAFVGKAKLMQLLPETGLARAVHPGFTAARVMREVLAHLERETPDLVFVHLPDPDTAGHAHGWGTPAQLAAVAATDVEIGRLLGWIERHGGRDRVTVLLTSDHGGFGKVHGVHHPREFQIEWIGWGRGFAAHTRIEAPVSTLDTFPTLAALLDLRTPPGLPGRVVAEALDHGRRGRAVVTARD